ncbi:MAG: sulfatase-like hydrolase/transferase [Erysipelotrichaceae bacterium]|nr:sulfatase-like hydrolase/transferase [Erysipelotrichaceae bacterium]
MGNEASITPNLDDILNEGVSFENAYCQNPVCVPSRNSFLTGFYPHTTGHRTMHYLQEENKTSILKEMKNNGYEVIWIGRNDFIPGDRSKADYCDMYFDGIHDYDTKDSTKSSFVNMGNEKKKSTTNKKPKDDNYYSFYIGKLKDGKEYSNFDWKCIESALNYLDNKKSDKPFLLYCTLTFPHPPYACEDPWYSSIDRSLLPQRRPNINTLKNRASMLYGIESKQGLRTWSEERFTELRATYLAMVSRFDYQFGMICDKLKEKNLYDDTNIIVFSDHGDYTGDYNITEKVQNCFEDPISNIPLIIKPSKQYDVVPRKTKALAELLNLPATIADIASIKLSYTQFGKSLMHVVAGDDTHKEAVFCEGGRIHGETQCMEGGHSPDSPYWPRLSTQSQEGPEHTKAVMCRIGNIKYTLRLYETDELYDLDNDPYELTNEIDNPKYQNIIPLFKEKILEYYMSTTDVVPMKEDIR